MLLTTTKAHHLQALREILATTIPITTALGFVVADYNGDCLTLAAPLAPNINDKRTVFAGSLSALATLTGWSVLWLALRMHAIPAQIVIQDSAMRYLQPVAGDFAARCYMPEPTDLEKFIQRLRRKGKGRLELEVDIWEGSNKVVAFMGRYVASVT